jgi:hypothetical protein
MIADTSVSTTVAFSTIANSLQPHSAVPDVAGHAHASPSGYNLPSVRELVSDFISRLAVRELSIDDSATTSGSRLTGLTATLPIRPPDLSSATTPSSNLSSPSHTAVHGCNSPEKATQARIKRQLQQALADESNGESGAFCPSLSAPLRIEPHTHTSTGSDDVKEVASLLRRLSSSIAKPDGTYASGSTDYLASYPSSQGLKAACDNIYSRRRRVDIPSSPIKRKASRALFPTNDGCVPDDDSVRGGPIMVDQNLTPDFPKRPKLVLDNPDLYMYSIPAGMPGRADSCISLSPMSPLFEYDRDAAKTHWTIGKGPTCSVESDGSPPEKDLGRRPRGRPCHTLRVPSSPPSPPFVPTAAWPSPLDQEKIRSNYNEFENQIAAKAAGEVSDESDPVIESAFLEASDDEEDEDVDVSGLSDDVMEMILDNRDSWKESENVEDKEVVLHAWI